MSIGETAGSREASVSLDEVVLTRIGRAMGEFSMLVPGERIGVGVSGGKDSLCMVHALTAYRRRAPFPYELVALTLDQGKFTAPLDLLGDFFRSIGMRWIFREEPQTLRLVAEGVAHGCDVCSRHRRGALYRLAAEAGCSVLALGHTADDCAESLLRNILFNGRIASLPPVASSRKGSMRVIRPLVYVNEEQTAQYVRNLGIDQIGCVCGIREGPRREIREFLKSMREVHPGSGESLMAALGNVAPYALFDSALRKEAADDPIFPSSDVTALQTPE